MPCRVVPTSQLEVSSQVGHAQRSRFPHKLYTNLGFLTLRTPAESLETRFAVACLKVSHIYGGYGLGVPSLSVVNGFTDFMFRVGATST